MTKWKCSVKPSALKDARASLGPLADKTYWVEAGSAEDALIKVTEEIDAQHPMTTLPSDLLEDWLVLEPADS
ncbi:hypothetical protein [Aquisalimonas sp.]|uniref:hypothetical protein n=1 Tax=Aquisalimonas sp. TaxID=1872621 RepID=UPI0025C2DB61|nr:hypothetical protein [Aquisalimonas sp.]